jgi:hypothetical protein
MNAGPKVPAMSAMAAPPLAVVARDTSSASMTSATAAASDDLRQMSASVVTCRYAGTLLSARYGWVLRWHFVVISIFYIIVSLGSCLCRIWYHSDSQIVQPLWDARTVTAVLRSA